jgi:hypothetical protein
MKVLKCGSARILYQSSMAVSFIMESWIKDWVEGTHTISASKWHASLSHHPLLFLTFESSSLQGPSNIPSTPAREYAGKGWAGTKDWLGTGILEFEEARELVRAKKLANQAAWKTWRKHDRPPYIPSNPEREYAGKGWVGYKDWLGTINLQVWINLFTSK